MKGELVLRALFRFFKFVLYAVLLLLGVTVAVSNRGHIDIILYPLPYAFNVPVFLFSLFLLTLGIIIGSGMSHLKVFRHRRAHKETSKRVAALENEIGALRSQHIHAPRSLTHS